LRGRLYCDTTLRRYDLPANQNGRKVSLTLSALHVLFGSYIWGYSDRQVAGDYRKRARLNVSIQRLTQNPADRRYGLPPLEKLTDQLGPASAYRYRHRPAAAASAGVSEVEAALLSIVDQLERDAEADELEVEQSLLCAIDELVEANPLPGSDGDGSAGHLLRDVSFWNHEKGPTADELVECLWTMWQLPDQRYGPPQDRPKIKSQVIVEKVRGFK
jgi:hypothetical protein